MAGLAAAMFIMVALIRGADGVQATALGALRGAMDLPWPMRCTPICYRRCALPLAAAVLAADGG
jgi:multidrug resistance protein, MATE family